MNQGTFSDYHDIGNNADINGYAPDKQIYGGIYYFANGSGMFVSHVPDNGIFMPPANAYVSSRIS